jgi:hypothetical protein
MHLKFLEIVALLFLMISTMSLIPWNAWGDEFYTYLDEGGTMFITNIYPEGNINFSNWTKHTYQNSSLTSLINKDDPVVTATISPDENIKANTRRSNSYQDSTLDERLHWGRDNALIDEQKGKNRHRTKVKNSGTMEVGIYDVNIKKIANNLFQDAYSHIIIKTVGCTELAGKDGSTLDWSGISGELFFKNTNKSCMVKKVYK